MVKWKLENVQYQENKNKESTEKISTDRKMKFSVSRKQLSINQSACQ